MTSIPPTGGPGRIEVVLTEAGLVSLLRRLNGYEITKPIPEGSSVVGVIHDLGLRQIRIVLQSEEILQRPGTPPECLWTSFEDSQ